MFDNALQTLVKSDQNTIDEYLPRLQTIVNKADGIGWGYYDTIIELLYHYFPPEE